MAWTDFKQVIDELSNLKVFFVVISGGEPFTHPLADKFITYAHKKFRDVVTITNGTILLKKHVDAITKVILSKGNFPIQVSIDAINPEINATTRCDSEKVLNNIQMLSKIGANITIAIVLSKFNKDYVNESIIQLSRYTKFFHIMPVQKVRSLNGADEGYGLSEAELNQFWNQIKLVRKSHNLHIETPFDHENEENGCATGAPCMSAFSQIVIDPTLKVRPCDRAVGTIIGDLKVSTIS